jgi:hypothetical protein
VKEYAKTQQLHQKPNLRIMGIKEREEVQTQRMHNIFNKVIAENSPNLEKELSI